MKFRLPNTDVEFEVPDEWWKFAEMDNFRSASGETYYPYQVECLSPIQLVAIRDVEPPVRKPGLDPFKKYKLVPVLLAFRSPECRLPPVEVTLTSNSEFKYRVLNGFHRYYASVAVGYGYLPVIVKKAEDAL